MTLDKGNRKKVHEGLSRLLGKVESGAESYEDLVGLTKKLLDKWTWTNKGPPPFGKWLLRRGWERDWLRGDGVSGGEFGHVNSDAFARSLHKAFTALVQFYCERDNHSSRKLSHTATTIREHLESHYGLPMQSAIGSDDAEACAVKKLSGEPRLFLDYLMTTDNVPFHELAEEMCPGTEGQGSEKLVEDDVKYWQRRANEALSDFGAVRKISVSLKNQRVFWKNARKET